MDESLLKNLPANSDCLFTLADVESALDGLIPALTQEYTDKTPLVLGVMNGALSTLGYLLPRLPFLLEVDYIHATRYRGAIQGGTLVWKAKPETSLQDRHVLLVDDVLDQGITLDLIRAYCLEQGAARVKTLVLGEKQIPGFKAPITADYRALYLPDRYIFGYGMDYQGYWRNAPGIFAYR